MQKMESCSTAAWPTPMSLIMDSTSALWPCNTTSRLGRTRTHTHTQVKYTSQHSMVWVGTKVRKWLLCESVGYLSYVFILVLSRRASSLAAWVSLCWFSRYFICFWKFQNPQNVRDMSGRKEHVNTFGFTFDNLTSYPENWAEHLFLANLLPNTVQVFLLPVHSLLQAL